MGIRCLRFLAKFTTSWKTPPRTTSFPGVVVITVSLCGKSPSSRGTSYLSISSTVTSPASSASLILMWVSLLFLVICVFGRIPWIFELFLLMKFVFGIQFKLMLNISHDLSMKFESILRQKIFLKNWEFVCGWLGSEFCTVFHLYFLPSY